MQPTDLDLILLAIIGLIIAASMFWSAVYLHRKAESKGYDAGYQDAQQQASLRFEALHEDLATLRAKHAADRKATEQQLAEAAKASRARLEAVMQDADQRIAHYARRSNPLTREDASWLMKVAGQLSLLEDMATRIDAESVAAQARTAHDQCKRLAQRVNEALDAAEADLVAMHPDYAETLAAVGKGNRSWMVFGPQGCGKTRNAQALAGAFNLPKILDDWRPGMPTPATDTLILTNAEQGELPFTRRLLPYEVAMTLVPAQEQAA